MTYLTTRRCLQDISIVLNFLETLGAKFIYEYGFVIQGKKRGAPDSLRALFARR